VMLASLLRTSRQFPGISVLFVVLEPGLNDRFRQKQGGVSTAQEETRTYKIEADVL
jgi:hypothetical protein